MSDATPEPSVEHSYLPPSAPPRNHGHTSASWTLVVILLVGAFVGAFAVALSSVTLAAVAGAIVLVGLVVGRVMQHMGYGQPADRASATH